MEGIRETQLMRHTRYQGAIIKEDQILLIKHTEHESGRSFWVIPGGGREAGETELACVAREMWEETNLVVRVERLLVETALPNDPFNKIRKTYFHRDRAVAIVTVVMCCSVLPSKKSVA